MVLILNKNATKKEIEQLNEKLREMPLRKTLDTKKYSGVIVLKEDPLAIQKKLRDAWE
jgi:hypothetical protein